jgi:hypothetical protein
VAVYPLCARLPLCELRGENIDDERQRHAARARVRIVQRNRRHGVQQGTLTGPTAVQTDRLQQLADDVKAAAGELDRLVGTTISNLNAEMDKAGIPRIVIPRVSSS